MPSRSAIACCVNPSRQCPTTGMRARSEAPRWCVALPCQYGNAQGEKLAPLERETMNRRSYNERNEGLKRVSGGGFT